METELRMFEEGLQVNIHSYGLTATLKRIANWENPSLDGVHIFWFKNPHP